MQVTMLRSLAKKPGAKPEDERLEGKTYKVSAAEGKELVAQGLAVEGDEVPDAGPSVMQAQPEPAKAPAKPADKKDAK